MAHDEAAGLAFVGFTVLLGTVWTVMVGERRSGKQVANESVKQNERSKAERSHASSEPTGNPLNAVNHRPPPLTVVMHHVLFLSIFTLWLLLTQICCGESETNK